MREGIRWKQGNEGAIERGDEGRAGCGGERRGKRKKKGMR